MALNYRGYGRSTGKYWLGNMISPLAVYPPAVATLMHRELSGMSTTNFTHTHIYIYILMRVSLMAGKPNPINLSRDVGQVVQWLKKEKVLQ